MEISATKKSIVLLIVTALILAACSYGHGIMRILTFDQDISDLDCLANQLEKIGYSVKETQENISYHPNSTGIYPRPIAHISVGRVSNEDGTYEKDLFTLVHEIYFGSAPVKCKIVKPYTKTLKDTEDRIFKACNLISVKKPKQRIRCR